MSLLLTWLIVLALVGVSCFIGADRWRKSARRYFLVLVSVFVCQSMFMAVSPGGRLSKARPVLEADRAELLLRFGTSLKVLQLHLLSLTGLSDGASRKGDVGKLSEKDFYEEAKEVLQDAVLKSPDVPILKAKLAIVLGDSGKTQYKPLLLQLSRELASRKNTSDASLGKALLLLYDSKKLSLTSASELAHVFKDSLPQGWYREAVLVRLYKVSGAQGNYKELTQDIQERAYRLLSNFVVLMVVVVVASLIGLVVILVQLFTVARTKSLPEEHGQALGAVPWNLKTVYSVFVFWLATQIVVGNFAPTLLKSSGMLSSGAIAVACATAILYLVSNGPGVLYVYLMAMRPHRIGFLEGIKLAARVGHRGPVRLILSGIATWCVALPLVMVAYFLASKILGSQGSSNPIIALVLETARSANCFATLLFYFTLGVLAPLCEETLFRGFLYRTLRKSFGVGTCLFVSASLFAIVHMDVGALVPLMCLGWLFGLVFERSKSLLPAIIAHGLWNSGTFTLVLMIFGS
ncbi:MAG: CPBP family intramembrane metalloprotease [Candidatus Melainabacteria bacterium]|nr:CPBP family intramembrane metalloprotease [Candidatus Melainabacteria bacterium]